MPPSKSELDLFDGLSYEDYLQLHLNGHAPTSKSQPAAGTSKRPTPHDLRVRESQMSNTAKINKGNPEGNKKKWWVQRIGIKYYNKIVDQVKKEHDKQIHELTAAKIAEVIKGMEIIAHSPNSTRQDYLQELINYLISRSEKDRAPEIVNTYSADTVLAASGLFKKFYRTHPGNSSTNYNSEQLKKFMIEMIGRKKYCLPEGFPVEHVPLCYKWRKAKFEAARKKRKRERTALEAIPQKEQQSARPNSAVRGKYSKRKTT